MVLVTADEGMAWAMHLILIKQETEAEKTVALFLLVLYLRTVG